jgi:transketolase
MLLYTQLVLNGYDLGLEDLKEFRRFESRTPGHPEYLHTKGVEMTTGPLGQGIATATGMALGARYLRLLLDPNSPPGESPFDHRVFVIASDGDLQEGVSAEAASLAGHHGLGSLIVLWDDNRISIDGATHKSFSEDVMARYRSYGWETLNVPMLSTGEVDAETLLGHLLGPSAAGQRPTFVRVQTTIAFPAPNARDTAAAHGAPLGAQEVAKTKSVLGLDPKGSFTIDPEVLTYTRESIEVGNARTKAWRSQLDKWRESNPQKARLLDRLVSSELPEDFFEGWPDFADVASMSTRKASGEALQVMAKKLPEIWGGSADLTESNQTGLKGELAAAPTFQEGVAGPQGRYVHFGVREHAMAAAINGVALGKLLRPFGGTFLIFSDYQKPAIRLSALMGVRSTFVWSHDSVGLGEDGPTHQPVEQLWSLRAIPNFAVIRPADATETIACWQQIIARNQPCGIALTRQNVPVLDRSRFAPADSTAKGGYVIAAHAEPGKLDAILMATGSEVHLAIEAHLELAKAGINTQVVSFPCLEWFEEQDEFYRQSVLPPEVTARVSIEAGSTQGWYKYVGSTGIPIGIDAFGASGAPSKIFEKFGLTVSNVMNQTKRSIELSAKSP